MSDSDPPPAPPAPPAPDPTPPAPPDPTPPAPADPPAPQGDRLDRLEGIVSGLVDMVAALAPKDERPTKVPWTHRGSARGDDQ